MITVYISEVLRYKDVKGILWAMWGSDASPFAERDLQIAQFVNSFLVQASEKNIQNKRNWVYRLDQQMVDYDCTIPAYICLYHNGRLALTRGHGHCIAAPGLPGTTSGALKLLSNDFNLQAQCLVWQDPNSNKISETLKHLEALLIFVYM